MEREREREREREERERERMFFCVHTRKRDGNNIILGRIPLSPQTKPQLYR